MSRKLKPKIRVLGVRVKFKYGCSQWGEADSEALHRHSELNERKELQVASRDVLVCTGCSSLPAFLYKFTHPIKALQ